MDIPVDIQFGNSNNLYLLGIVAVGIGLTGWAIIARRRSAKLFASPQLRDRILPPDNRSRHWVSAILVSLSLALLAVALTDIRWGKTLREVPQKGIEVMFVLDVSRSMLAEDASPNRLARAKQQIKDLMDAMVGDRVGLITFAGESRQSVPLTSHYEDFKQTLDSVGPHSVRSGGSRLGDALAAAGSGFLTKTNDHKAIVVFTDGEDQESNPVNIAERLYTDEGIRIFTIGLGDMDQGARVPESDDGRGGYVKYNGQQVWSKMNGEVLKQIAEKTDGAYVPAGTRRVNMADVYHRYIANVAQENFETAKIKAYIVRYQWFAVPALALVLLEVFLSTRSAKMNAVAKQSTLTNSEQTNRAA